MTDCSFCSALQRGWKNKGSFAALPAVCPSCAGHLGAAGGLPTDRCPVGEDRLLQHSAPRLRLKKRPLCISHRGRAFIHLDALVKSRMPLCAGNFLRQCPERIYGEDVRGNLCRAFPDQAGVSSSPNTAKNASRSMVSLASRYSATASSLSRWLRRMVSHRS